MSPFARWYDFIQSRVVSHTTMLFLVGLQNLLVDIKLWYLTYYTRMTNLVCFGSESEQPKTWSMHSQTSNCTVGTADSEGETSETEQWLFTIAAIAQIPVNALQWPLVFLYLEGMCKAVISVSDQSILSLFVSHEQWHRKMFFYIGVHQGMVTAAPVQAMNIR